MQSNFTCELARDVNITRGEVNKAGQDDEIVEGESIFGEELLGGVPVTDGLVTKISPDSLHHCIFFK